MGTYHLGINQCYYWFCAWLCHKTDIVSVTRNGPRRLSGKHAEVILIVNCEEQQADEIEKILWEHFALGVAKVKLVLNEEG